jgi:hypothetical protein
MHLKFEQQQTTMNVSSTSLNTMFNASDRWKDNDDGEELCSSFGDLALKTPKRRPSLYIESDEEGDDDEFTAATDPVDSTSTLGCDYDDYNESFTTLQFLEGACFDTREYASSRAHRSDSFLYVSQCAVPENKHLRRRIRFAPSVEQREYALTVSDNPSCMGPCALTLDWSHTESKKVHYNDSLHRGNSRPVKQLSSDARRRRVMRVGSLDEEELQKLELELVTEKVKKLQEKVCALAVNESPKLLTSWPRPKQAAPTYMGRSARPLVT